MVSIVFTYRNRSLNIVRRCLNSLATQTNIDFTIFIVNYGSEIATTKDLERLIEDYENINYIYCDTSKQLWNKSKAINIVLKLCKTPYFFVGDIDMIFKNNFVDTLVELKKQNEITYFQVGFLSEFESNVKKEFEKYKIKHISKEATTGMTLYPTELLKSICGFDEFYHGWGSEDTDVHLRLQHKNIKVNFYTKDVLILHQWHSRDYRSKKSKEPLHSSLEQVNQSYLQQVALSGDGIANSFFGWGINNKPMPFIDVIDIAIQNKKSDIDALIIGSLSLYREKEIVITVYKHPAYKSLKNSIKPIFGKKQIVFYNFQEINDLLLSMMISRFRTNYYEYEWCQITDKITLKIAL